MKANEATARSAARSEAQPSTSSQEGTAAEAKADPVDQVASTPTPRYVVPAARQALDGAFSAAFGEPIRFRTYQRNDVAETLRRLHDRLDDVETELAALRKLCESQQSALAMTPAKSQK